MPHHHHAATDQAALDSKEKHDRREATQDARAAGVLGRGLRLGRVAGIDVVVDWSILVIFLLVLTSLALGVLPQWHPLWSPALIWGVAAASATLFFASILAHELSHALAGRAFGVEIRSITLFLFGGMAHMEQESRSPRAELLIALAGPAASAAIGAAAIFAGALLASPDLPTGQALDPGRVASSLGPGATLLLWLGPINLMLAAFNLVPGFPLDGGRVLRAIIWWATGSLDRATRWATTLGQAFAWVLMGSGVAMALGLRVPFFGTGLVGGLWLLLIGWFLNSAARMSFEQFAMMRALENVSVSDLMRSRIDTVTPDLPVDVLVREHILHTDQRAFPVTQRVDDDTIAGLVTLDDVRKVGPGDWATTSVSAIMTPADRLLTTEPGARAKEAFARLARHGVDQIPVVEEGHLRGVVRRQDILKWLALRADVVTT